MKRSDNKKKFIIAQKMKKKLITTPPIFNPTGKKNPHGYMSNPLVNCIKILFLKHFLSFFSLANIAIHD